MSTTAKAEQKPWDANLRMDGEASQRSKNTQAEFCHTTAASRIVKPVPATCFQPNYASFSVCLPCALFKVSHRHFSGPCCEFFTTPSWRHLEPNWSEVSEAAWNRDWECFVLFWHLVWGALMSIFCRKLFIELPIPSHRFIKYKKFYFQTHNESANTWMTFVECCGVNIISLHLHLFCGPMDASWACATSLSLTHRHPHVVPTILFSASC